MIYSQYFLTTFLTLITNSTLRHNDWLSYFIRLYFLSFILLFVSSFTGRICINTQTVSSKSIKFFISTFWVIVPIQTGHSFNQINSFCWQLKSVQSIESYARVSVHVFLNTHTDIISCCLHLHITAVMTGSCAPDSPLDPTILSPLVISCDLFVLSGEPWQCDTK